ncbi:MAG TPA: RHS repeat-associated core domain-containing protein [Fimbriimonas sp.]|nr:RHS repeat-associated core domain-containing protein [Fimbriimonas sp.]
MRSDWANHRIQKQLAEGGLFEGLFASIEESFFDGGGGSGGGSGPGEGGGGSGGSGGGGTGGVGGLGGQTNTNTGNNQQKVPIVAWSSKGESGLAFSLWHNSKDNDDGIFGKGWRHSFEASLAYTTGTSAIIKMPDGLVVPYTEASGVFTPPAGWNESLVMNGDGSFTMTFKSGAKFEFTSAGLLSSVKDKSGNTTTVNRDTFGSITSISSVDGRTLTFAYSSGKVSSVTDPTSRVWTFAYDGSLDLTGITYPALSGSSYTRTFTYNANHDILTETDLTGSVWTWTYDTSERMTSYSNPLSQTTTFGYTTTATTITQPGGQVTTHNYSSGLLASEVDPASYSKSYTYNSNRDILTLTDQRGKVWTYTYDSKGNVLTATNPLSQTTTVTYSSQNNPLTVTNPASGVTTMTYDGAGRLLTVVDPLSRTSVTNTYDSFGQRLTTKDALNRTSTFAYTGNGDVSRVTQPSGVYTDFAYDTLGRNTTKQDVNANTWSTSYDNWGRPVSSSNPAGATSTVAYDLEGRVTSSTDPLSRASTRTYNSAGRLTSEANPRGDTQSYGYNSNGWVTSITNGRGKIRTYEHTNRGEVKKLTMPDGAIEQWTFNGTGQTTVYTSPLAYVINYSFDDAGQATGVDYPTGTDTAFTKDSIGRTSQMVDATGTTTWTYNAASEVTQLAQPQGTQTYTYNTAGQRDSMTEVGLGTTNYTFDSAGRQSTVTNRFGETTTWTYDTRGLVSKRTHSSGAFDSYTYDTSMRLTGAKVVTSGLSTLKNETYGYNLANEMTSRVLAGVTTVYTYDAASQLLSEARTGYSASYTYDANGNRLTKTSGGVTDNYSYDDGDKMLTAGAKSYTYDAAGRTTAVTVGANTTNVTYDYESRISTVSGPGISGSYTYNGLDTRVSKIENSVSQTFARDGVGVTAPVLRDSSASYTPGIAERRGSSTTFLHSGIKNAEAQSGTSQTITGAKQSDAFGNTLISSGTWNGPFGYAGGFGYQEDASGLKLLGHRYYDSSTGRFLTRDPVKDGRNWYNYAENKPNTGADPTGTTALLLLGVAQSVLVEPAPSPGRKGGENDSTRNGRAWHKALQAWYVSKYPGSRAEAGYEEHGIRPDIVDYTRKVVIEIKPDSESGIKKGDRQIVLYMLALNYDKGLLLLYPRYEPAPREIDPIIPGLDIGVIRWTRGLEAAAVPLTWGGLGI